MTDWEDDIKRYSNGEMSPEEEHALEKKALSDPFLAEALEGASLITSQQFSDDLTELRKKINQRTKKKIWLWPLRIAASVALIAIAYVAIAPLLESSNNKNLALEQAEHSGNQQEGFASTNDSVDLSALDTLSLSALDRNSKIQEDKKSNRKEKENPLKQDATIAQPSPLTLAEANNEGRAAKPSEQEVAEAIAEGEKISSAQAKDANVKKELGFLSAEDKTARRERTLANERVVQGNVVSAEDGTPVPGANVIIKGTSLGTVTDINGHYKLAVPSLDATLVYSFIGLQTQEVNAKNPTEIVKLQPDVAQLSEVVVTGYSAIRADETREPVIKLAEPKGGKRAYDKYLKNSLQYPVQALENKIKGRVTVQFTVRTDGSLDEFNVLKGLGHGCDEEVIRLVKEGPTWSPTTEDNVAVESEVRVRVKFALPD